MLDVFALPPPLAQSAEADDARNRTVFVEHEYEQEHEKAWENMDLGSEILEHRNFKTSALGCLTVLWGV
jgi:hypothetical protein